MKSPSVLAATVVERAVTAAVRHGIRRGSLTIRWPDSGAETIRGTAPGPHAELTVHDRRLLRRVATSGGNGLADSYIAGEFDSDDLSSIIELGALHMERDNQPLIARVLAAAAHSAWRWLGNTASNRGPVRDIVHHYDLGNAFYEQWLDESMTYSSALFSRPNMTLEEAQQEKYRRLAERTGIARGARVLEIGSGWGGFATYLAGGLGAEVTTVTVSREQAEYVGKLAAGMGIADLIEVRQEDFTATPGTYDAIVSVEMIESIPGRRWPEYFRTLSSRLAPGGSIGLQAITIADRHWTVSDANPDFARRYIFPGGQIPAPQVLRKLAADNELTWMTDESFGRSYAMTLGEWRRRFDASWPRISRMGFDEGFRRMWDYYLSYCEGGFRSGRIDVSQIVLSKEPAWR